MSLDALAGANGAIPPISDIDAPVIGVKGLPLLPLCEPNPPWRPAKDKVFELFNLKHTQDSEHKIKTAEMIVFSVDSMMNTKCVTIPLLLFVFFLCYKTLQTIEKSVFCQVYFSRFKKPKDTVQYISLSLRINFLPTPSSVNFFLPWFNKKKKKKRCTHYICVTVSFSIIRIPQKLEK